jgi:hypothetical protein
MAGLMIQRGTAMLTELNHCEWRCAMRGFTRVAP